MTSGALASGRVAAESLMQDTGTARRPTGETTYDPEAQGNVPVYDADFEEFTSICKVKPPTRGFREEDIGGRTSVTMLPILHLPVGTPALLPGDEWEMTAAGPLSTVPVGRVYRVVGPAEGSLVTAMRYEVEVIL